MFCLGSLAIVTALLEPLALPFPIAFATNIDDVDVAWFQACTFVQAPIGTKKTVAKSIMHVCTVTKVFYLQAKQSKHAALHLSA